MTQLQDKAIGLDDFVGVAWPNSRESRYRTQRYQMLDWLVSRTIFAIAHRLMREYEQRGQFHERREANRRSRIVAEDEERCTKWPQLRQRHSVHDRCHGMLANTEMQGFSLGGVGL